MSIADKFYYLRNRYLYVVCLLALAHAIGGAVIVAQSNDIQNSSPDNIWTYSLVIMLFSWLTISASVESQQTFGSHAATKFRTWREISCIVGVIWGGVIISQVSESDIDFYHTETAYWKLYVYYMITFIYSCILLGLDVIFEIVFFCIAD